MASEDRTLRVQFGDAEPVPLGELLTRVAEADPHRTALTISDRSYTRREVDAASNRRARYFAQLGVQRGDFVTIALPNTFEFHVSAFAAWKLGATPAPVSYRLPDHELSAIVGLVAPKLVSGAEAARLPGFPTLPAGFEPDLGISDARMPTQIAPHWSATASGGSTGRPKVIVAQRAGVLDPNGYGFGIRPDDVMLNPGPLYHNAGFGFGNMGLCWGLHVVEMPKFDAQEALRLIEKHRVTWAFFVPTMMNRIWALPTSVRESYDISSLRTVLHMAAPCPAWLKEAWIEWLGPDAICELYSATESMGATTIGGREWLTHRGSVGRLPDEGTIRVIREDGSDCGAHEIGEIFFRPAAGQGSTYRYLGAEAKAVGEWETYGDMGWTDEDQYLYLADRRTDLVISGGANIYPAEIEAAMDSHPVVASSVAVGLPDPDMGQRVHAIVELEPGAEPPDPLVFHTFLAERLVAYKLPRTVEFVREPLRNDAGKVRRSALRQERIDLLATGHRFTSLR